MLGSFLWWLFRGSAEETATKEAEAEEEEEAEGVEVIDNCPKTFDVYYFVKRDASQRVRDSDLGMVDLSTRIPFDTIPTGKQVIDALKDKSGFPQFHAYVLGDSEPATGYYQESDLPLGEVPIRPSGLLLLKLVPQ